jgi:hypothetical protein
LNKKIDKFFDQMSTAVQSIAECDMLTENLNETREHSYIEFQPEEEVCAHEKCLAKFGPIPKQTNCDDFIQCSKCKQWYHSLCFGYQDELPKRWKCIKCKGKIQ